MARNSLALEAYKRGMSEPDLLRFILERSTSIQDASKQLKLSYTSVLWNMEKYGIKATKITRLEVETIRLMG